MALRRITMAPKQPLTDDAFKRNILVCLETLSGVLERLCIESGSDFFTDRQRVQHARELLERLTEAL
jgi:hypothetical protein